MYIFLYSNLKNLSVDNECKCQILSLIYPYTSQALHIYNIYIYIYYIYIYIYIYIYRTHTQGYGNSFCSSVGGGLIACSIPSRRPSSCIFHSWSWLGLKMYIFLTLEFTLCKCQILSLICILCI